MRKRAIGLLFSFFLLFLIAQDVKAQLGVSDQDVINAGIQAHQQIMQQYSAWNDPAELSRVQRVGNNLTRFSERPEISYQFYLLNSDEINAMATPDGSVHVTKGLLTNFTNDNELSFVLGHEITHVELNHAKKQIEQAQATQVGEDILSILLGQNSTLANFGIGAAGYWLMMKYSRDDEYQADQGGMQFLQKAGIDPHWGIQALQHLASLNKDQPSLIARFFSDHPLDDVRIQVAKRVADNLQPPTAAAAPVPVTLQNPIEQPIPLSLRGDFGGRVYPINASATLVAVDSQNNILAQTHPNRKGYYKIFVPEGRYIVTEPRPGLVQFTWSGPLEQPVSGPGLFGIAVYSNRKTALDLRLNP